jgi:perosamine synthetase
VNTAAPARTLGTRILDTIRGVTGPGSIALHEPCFGGNEWAYVKECLDSSYVSSVGPFVDRLERDLADYTGARRAIAVANGTVALQVAMRLGGVEPGNEVLVPALTFVATAAAVVHAGAVPHFVDAEERTLGVDPRALRAHLERTCSMQGGECVNRSTGRVVRALVPMHTFGHPADVEGLLSVAHDYHLTLIEDAAESLGSTIGGRHAGTFGRLSTLSFNGNKTITTGGGGAILTNDSALGARAKHLTTTAKVPHRWAFVHDDVGYNFRMPNLNAALGCAQLEQLDAFVASKRALFERYRTAFRDIGEVRVFAEPDECRSNYWLQTLLLDASVEDQRDDILAATNDAGIMTRPAWALMHRLGPYANYPRMELPVAESLERRIINIPSSAQLMRRVPSA